MSLSVTWVVNALLYADELFCPINQSDVANAGQEQLTPQTR